MSRRLPLAASLATCFLLALPACAQTPLDQAIVQRYPLTKATADRSDIVTAGTVMTLKKDGLLTFSKDHGKSQIVVKDGRFTASGMTKMAGFSFAGHSTTNAVQRTFVAGEKLFLIDEQTLPDGVQLTLMSDAIQDVRYIAYVKFPFPKGSPPAPDVILTQIDQVMAADGAPAPAAAAAPAPPPAAPMAAIPPPPPPPDQPAAPPPTLEKGQTKDQVIAGFGQPVRVVKLGTKEIDYYKDMKITYVGGKVSNVE
ncbi:hypothetical protein SAMN05421770_101257 [Granulicella rosea]|uniref:Uncharacterized protein n=1 Tax=Granulicella rosea TaxID=474952 RepID=A0A239D321_9BACT|nr:hypothetical protein [Granulicella rosea]SNS26609.1 hypothetical protein SAMN05421770_101257 [Granulicella rosea]